MNFFSFSINREFLSIDHICLLIDQTEIESQLSYLETSKWIYWIFQLIENDVGVMSLVKIWLSSQFDMKDLGESNYILGIKLSWDQKNRMLGLSQVGYIDKIRAKFSMQNSKKWLLPFRHGVPLSDDQRPKTLEEEKTVRQVPYASAVGSLMYAMLCTRPDICYSVGIVSRYQSNLGPKHWEVVKHILKYLRRTRDYMLVYWCEDLIPIG